MKFFAAATLLLFLNVINCQGQEIPSDVYENPPTWARNVIWYEISVERFRNGDPSNDPTADDIKGAYPGFVPEGWAVTPWTQDWYKADPYFSNLIGQPDLSGQKIDKFVDAVQMRRYGGDLKGVMDKIDYLESLGVTAIYFRPLNDAPSLHKYDARNWRHIDVNFGPDPEGDKKIIASEVPDDPTSWKMTSADKLFVELVSEFHRRGIRVIIDYSVNHTGSTFWAWQDILKNQANSKYKDWYWVKHFDDPTTPENEFSYHGWAGVSELPEIKETQKQDLSKSLTSFEGNLYSDKAKQHFFNVIARWLDPNGDGDPSDGVDGYRLDVAAETPLGFWREFRKHVRSINPEAFLMGEIWWEEWPDKLLDPEPYLKGDIFDAVMNYRWYRAARHFFNQSPHKIAASELIDSLQSFQQTIRDENDYAMMNYTGGFDTPRLLTSLFNKNKYKHFCKLHERPEYKIHKPDAATYQTLKLLLIHQYTYVGAPHIYAGDEMGMWGADDPSSRKPLIWKDYAFEDERAHALGHQRPVDKVKFDDELFGFYQKVIQMRKSHPVLIGGKLEFIEQGEKGIFAYKRTEEEKEIIVAFNSTAEALKVELPASRKADYYDFFGNQTVKTKGKKIRISMPARTAVVLMHH